MLLNRPTSVALNPRALAASNRPAAAALNRPPTARLYRRGWRSLSAGHCSRRQGAIIQPGVIPVERLFRPIARPDQRPRHTLQKPSGQRPLAVLIKLGRRDKTLNGKMIDRRPQVLPEGDD